MAGLEIGSISVKWVVVEPQGTVDAMVIPHEGNPQQVTAQLLQDHTFSGAVAATGRSAKALFDFSYYPETECLERALQHLELEPDILIALGGETFTLYTLRNGEIRNLITPPKCAAGSGEFLNQQFQRMGLTLEQGLALAEQGELVALATRCSVYCKSDATHKLNKAECSIADIARSLIFDLAEKVRRLLDTTSWPSRSILLCGGVTLNKPFLNALQGMLPNSEITVLEVSPYLEALGAALYAAELSLTCDHPREHRHAKQRPLPYELLPRLTDAEPYVDYRASGNRRTGFDRAGEYVLCVDAGSTTTKAVLFNLADDSLGAVCYLRTNGNPLAATRQCINSLLEQTEQAVKVVQAGVTGSGRELVSVFLGNAQNFNEILAHGRAAVQTEERVDTVFEIGGQDSKFIALAQGRPIDYAMNDGCSAGTGSFLEETISSDMGIAVEQIAAHAMRSLQPLGFGERCAAFMNTDMRNALQQGATTEDVIAGLVYSIAKNYVSRVVSARAIGQTLLFQGGLALNRAVALALATMTRRQIIVPPYPELMGCIGVGLMVRDRMRSGQLTRGSWDLMDAAMVTMEVGDSFDCPSCDNRCTVSRFRVGRRTYPFGGLCSKYEQSRRGRKAKEHEGRDLIALRNELLLGEFGPQPLANPRGRIGIPMALSTYQLLPFYTGFWHSLGLEVVLSAHAPEGNTRATGFVCYPCEYAHGTIADLLRRDVDYIFFPHLIDASIPEGFESSYMCIAMGAIPKLISDAFPECTRLLTPILGLSARLQQTTTKQLIEMVAQLGIHPDDAREAALRGYQRQQQFSGDCADLSRRELLAIEGQPAVVVAGKPYVAYCPETNLGLPRKIVSRGYHAIPMDLLPRMQYHKHDGNVWHYTQQVTNAIAYVRANPSVYLCLLSCFSCGPDGIMYHHFRSELEGNVYCYLEIDSHTALAGFETRLGAFLDIIEQERRALAPVVHS